MSFDALSREELIQRIRDLSDRLEDQTFLNIELRAIADLYDHTQEITRTELILAKETISAQDNLLHLTTRERKDARHTMDAFKNLQNLSQEELLHKNNTLQKILTINNEITGIPKKEILLSYILDSILPVLKAQRGILFVGKNNHFNPKYFKNFTKEEIFSPGFKGALSIVKDTVRERSVILLPSKQKKIDSKLFLGATDVLCAPLKNKDETLGILYLDSSASDFAFTLQDAETLEIFTAQAAIAIQNSNLYYNLEKEVLDRTKKLRSAYKKIQFLYDEIEKDLKLAKRVQDTLLTQHYEKIDTLDFKIHYEPMARIGGDIYDICRLSDKVMRVFLADATGHGIQAALVTMLIKGIYDKVKLQQIPANEIMSQLGEEFFVYHSLNAFFSAIIIDIDISQNQIEFSSAGHPDQIILRKEKLETLSSTGKMIGLKKKIEYRLEKRSFSKDETLFLYTDGIVEEFNDQDQMFGDESFFPFLESQKGLHPAFLIPDILQALKAFTKGKKMEDDVTLLTIARS